MCFILCAKSAWIEQKKFIYITLLPLRILFRLAMWREGLWKWFSFSHFATELQISKWLWKRKPFSFFIENNNSISSFAILINSSNYGHIDWQLKSYKINMAFKNSLIWYESSSFTESWDKTKEKSRWVTLLVWKYKPFSCFHLKKERQKFLICNIILVVT